MVNVTSPFLYVQQICIYYYYYYYFALCVCKGVFLAYY